MNNDDAEFEKMLNDFINTQLEDVDIETTPAAPKQAAAEDVSPIAAETPATGSDQPEDLNSDSTLTDEDDKEISFLKKNEKALFKAYRNYKDAIDILADDFHLKTPVFRLEANMLYPNYKPSTGKMIAEDTVRGWDVMIKSHPEIKEKINPNASDEEILTTAESCDDDALQFALISYVEILIEMEGCEISYKERKLKHEKKKLEREIYEEHQKRIARINRYIEAIKEKNFPVDAERLVKNYFKTAQKDADGAYKVLTQNPAVFAPIDFSKIKPRFFGLIKVKPQDGIRINRLIGDFLKKLKA